MRGEVNAVGVPTKKLPANTASSFMSDDELTDNIKAIDKAVELAIELAMCVSGVIVIPEQGLGTGLAKLEEKAPQTFAYLQQRLRDMEGTADLGGIRVYVKGRQA